MHSEDLKGGQLRLAVNLRVDADTSKVKYCVHYSFKFSKFCADEI